jgi:hypothetical protein
MVNFGKWSHPTHDVNHISRRVLEKGFLERSGNNFVPSESDEQH